MGSSPTGPTRTHVALAEALAAPLLTVDRRLAPTAARYCETVD
ncbi:hypothetical protein [Protaetiibacter intestinalis]|nr:hypothetical protein [Protaetiibacter intestinalis]